MEYFFIGFVIFAIAVVIVGLIFVLRSDKTSKASDVCPVCLGDGRDEGWKTAFPCKACGGDGKFHFNEMTMMEVKRSAAQAEINAKKEELPYVEYKKWLNDKYEKK